MCIKECIYISVICLVSLYTCYVQSVYFCGDGEGGCVACGILVPRAGVELGPSAGKTPSP